MTFDQPISKELFRAKYMINGETSEEEVFEEVAKEISQAERTDELKEYYRKEFLEVLLSRKLMAGGRILANARTFSKMKNYNNCFTIDIEDSMKGIFDSLAEDATISAAGGGVGFDISKLRPEGSSISRGGTTSGPLSFLKIFNESAKVIHTGGNRRSAHIALMDVSHPDIEKFITIKHGDKDKQLDQFNISVSITDKFIDAVDNDLDWDLTFNNKVYKTVKAKYLYDLIVKNAYEHNEPGIFNKDTVEKYNNGWWAFKIDRVNPCFTGDTIIAVADGRNGVSIKQLAEESKLSGEFPVYSARKRIKNSHFGYYKTEIKKAIAFKTGEKEVIEVLLSDGSSFECTKDHKLATKDGRWIDAQFSEGEVLEKFFTFSNKNSKKNYRHINSKTNGFQKQYRMIYEFNNGEYDGKNFNIDHIDNNASNDALNNLSLIPKKEHAYKSALSKQGKNNPIFKMNYDLRTWVSKKRNILANSSRWNWSKEKTELALNEFLEKNPKPAAKDKNICMNNSVYVEKIIYTGKVEEVYDLTVEDNHNFYIITKTDDDKYMNCSGVLVHNCGEITMPAYSLCCLSSINLTKFVLDPFKETSSFNWEDYKRTISLGIRFLDNVLDRTDYPLKKIEDVSRKWRRIGLGFTGLADAFAMLGIEYGSEESLHLSELLASALRDVSYRASVELAKEKGSFPGFDIKILQSNFIKQLPEDIQESIKLNGLRNIGLNTCAPNGTISLTVGENCSSGIEPIFALSYDRNIRTGVGEETRKETVFDYAYLKFLELKDSNQFSEEYVNSIFITTDKIDPYKSVNVQAVWQKYIDHSISKTANLPKNYSFDEYKNLFMYAYKSGLKGFTSFNPSGSMKGVLETTQEKINKKIEKHNAPKRPVDLPCSIHNIKVKEERFLILVGLYENDPYEVFVTNITEDIVVPNHYDSCLIRKYGKGNYDLVVQNGSEKIAIKNIGKTFNTDYESMSRLISASLRHGVPLQFVVEQLSKDTSFVSFSKAISRVLKHYIKGGECVLSSEVCPECGGELQFVDGCKSCPSCGWSKCS